MTGHAGGSWRVGRVVMMLGHIVTGGKMAAGADGITVRVEAEAVDLMAVAADDPLVIHTALNEGAEDIDLLLDLAVGEIEVRLQ